MEKNILVVDDDESILEVVQLVLESEGYDVQTSMNSSFFQSITVLPDLILLDMLLSGEDGREICRQIKADERLKYVPVIMLSAHSDASRIADMSGADGFLEKPFDVDVLIRVVQRHIEATR